MNQDVLDLINLCSVEQIYLPKEEIIKPEVIIKTTKVSEAISSTVSFSPVQK